MMDLLFSLCLALLITHQLDAVRARIWRVLPVLNGMSEETGRAIFILAHIPLLLALLEWCWSADGDVSGFWRFVVAVFGPLNLGLHRLLAQHPYYDFHAPLSRGLILAYAAAGGLYVLLTLVL